VNHVSWFNAASEGVQAYPWNRVESLWQIRIAARGDNRGCRVHPQNIHPGGIDPLRRWHGASRRQSPFGL